MSDRTTIGLTSIGRDVIDYLVKDLVLFKEQRDAAKFAASLAIREGVGFGTTEGAETVWNVGTIDPDGEMKGIIQALYPDIESPYAFLEYLIDRGLNLIKDNRDSNGGIDIYELIENRQDLQVEKG